MQSNIGSTVTAAVTKIPQDDQQSNTTQSPAPQNQGITDTVPTIDYDFRDRQRTSSAYKIKGTSLVNPITEIVRTKIEQKLTGYWEDRAVLTSSNPDRSSIQTNPGSHHLRARILQTRYPSNEKFIYPSPYGIEQVSISEASAAPSLDEGYGHIPFLHAVHKKPKFLEVPLAEKSKKSPTKTSVEGWIKAAMLAIHLAIILFRRMTKS